MEIPVSDFRPQALKIDEQTVCRRFIETFNLLCVNAY